MKTLPLTAALAATFTAVLLTGCTSGTQVSEEQRSQFQTGTTTKAQVEAALGAPDKTATLVGGGTRDIYAYHSGDSRPIDYVPLLALVAGGGWQHTTTVDFDFNTQGVLVATDSTRTRG
jgi:outer membrane protein assembly factor BamE (lipoprotein component of BamABCDE complex)